MKPFIPLALISLLMPLAASAQSYSPDWQQDALELIEDGKLTQAEMLLEDVENRQSFVTNPQERIEMSQNLGATLAKLGQDSRAAEHFERAMQDSLLLKPERKRLPAAIAVLSLQAETKDTATGQELLQQTLDAKLLPNMQQGFYAEEAGKLVKQFEASASYAQIGALIDQIRGLDIEAIRREALSALSAITFPSPEKSARQQALILPIGMDDSERFLWFAVTAKYYASAGEGGFLKEQKQQLSRSFDRLSKAQQAKHRALYRKIQKL